MKYNSQFHYFYVIKFLHCKELNSFWFVHCCTQCTSSSFQPLLSIERILRLITFTYTVHIYLFLFFSFVVIFVVILVEIMIQSHQCVECACACAFFRKLRKYGTNIFLSPLSTYTYTKHTYSIYSTHLSDKIV